jgi:hypothetical protein
MMEFDFLVDDRFRASRIADYAEFQVSLSADAWKVALVVLGIIERLTHIASELVAALGGLPSSGRRISLLCSMP